MTMRVVVVDDHPLFRAALRDAVATLDDVTSLAECGLGREAIDLVRSTGADLVLMDLGLPDISGIEATRELAGMAEPPAVLVVTMVDDDDTVLAALAAGARGYLLKGCTSEEVTAAVRTVTSGGAVLGPGVAVGVLARGGGDPEADDMGLTAREREVLELLAAGAGNREIARSLGVSIKTVQNHVSRILVKLQVEDRTQAALRARGG